MIEVLKTDVNQWEHAKMLMDEIHKTFSEYKANFDLDDCDKILRVICMEGSVHASLLIDLLKDFGFNAEVLPDTVPILAGFDRIYSIDQET